MMPDTLCPTTSPVDTPNTIAESGSFRDVDNRVFYHQGQVYRALGAEAFNNWKAVASRPRFQALMQNKTLTPTWEASLEPEDLPAALAETKWAGYLRHKAIPFLSYPYEWSFSMLKDAALLHMELITQCLDEEMILKDASAFNVQWFGSQASFIDIPSIEPLRPGDIWQGYGQFCRMFLYPLMLQAYKQTAFHPWLRGDIEGIQPQTLSQLMSWRDTLRPGVMQHVKLQAALQNRLGQSRQSIRNDLREVGFDKALILNNVRQLTRLVQSLRWLRASASEWEAYTSTCTYNDTETRQKMAFVASVAESRHWNLVWDLGCNTGNYSRIAARHASYTVAMDADHASVDRLYQALKQEGCQTILPLVMNLAQPSPGLGWRGRERKGLAERGTPDLVLCLALIHHLVISANLPLPEVIGWLAGLGADVVIEFVDRHDPKVIQLLRNKSHQHDAYCQKGFLAAIGRHFTIVQEQPLEGNSRTLYWLKPTH